MPKKDRAKKVGKEVKRVLDRGSNRVARIRNELQAPAGYTPQALARDLGEIITDTVDFFMSFLGGGSSNPAVLMSGPRVAYNTPGGAEVTRDSVSLDDALDPTLVLTASQLALVGGADVVPFNRVPIVIEEGGWVITARLLAKQNAADPSIAAGLYIGVITTPPNVVVAQIQLHLT